MNGAIYLLIVQCYYNLSDDQTEYAILDRLSLSGGTCLLVYRKQNEWLHVQGKDDKTKSGFSQKEGG